MLAAFDRLHNVERERTRRFGCPIPRVANRLARMKKAILQLRSNNDVFEISTKRLGIEALNFQLFRRDARFKWTIHGITVVGFV